MAGGIVTVVGAGGTHVSVTVNGGGAFTLAQAYASAVNSATSLFTSSGSTGGTVTPAGGSAVNEFVATTGGYYAFPSGYDHFVTQTTSAVTIDATAATSAQSLNTLVGTGGATYLAGNETNSTFIAGGGNNVFINSGTGTYNIATSDGNDTIFSGSGATSIQAGTGSNFVSLGSGSDTVTSTGIDKIFAGSGSDTVNLTASASTVYGSSGFLTVNDTGTGNSISGGTGMASIIGGTDGSYTLSGTSTVFGGTGDTISASGNTTVFAGAGNLLVNDTGSSSLFFVGSTGSATVNAGSASALVFGVNGTNLTYSGGGIVVAGVGNETLNGSGSTQGFEGFVSNIDSNKATGVSIAGGSGADTLVAGLGTQTLSGGAGANLFVLAKNGTSDTANPSGANITISDFGSSTSNLVGLFGYGAGEVATALGTAANVAGGVQITLGDGSKVTFTGLTTTTLNHNSFFGG